MAEDGREDLEAGGEVDSSLTPDESMVEPISEKSLVEKTSDDQSRGEQEQEEYERSSTLRVKGDIHSQAIIGPAPTALRSHWSRASQCRNIFKVMLPQLSYAMKTQLKAPIAPYKGLCLGHHLV